MSDVEVAHDSGAGRYRLMLDQSEIGFLEYDPIGRDAVLIKHVEVVPGHEGKGYAQRLVRHALDDIRAGKRSVVPICPYTLAFIRRNREYVDLVRDDLRSAL